MREDGGGRREEGNDEGRRRREDEGRRMKEGRGRTEDEGGKRTDDKEGGGRRRSVALPLSFAQILIKFVCCPVAFFPNLWFAFHSFLLCTSKFGII
jgi:hypothetical protein